MRGYLESPRDKILDPICWIWGVLDPFDKNWLYYTQFLSKIWDLNNSKKLVNNFEHENLFNLKWQINRFNCMESNLLHHLPAFSQKEKLLETHALTDWLIRTPAKKLRFRWKPVMMMMKMEMKMTTKMTMDMKMKMKMKRFNVTQCQVWGESLNLRSVYFSGNPCSWPWLKYPALEMGIYLFNRQNFKHFPHQLMESQPNWNPNLTEVAKNCKKEQLLKHKSKLSLGSFHDIMAKVSLTFEEAKLCYRTLYDIYFPFMRNFKKRYRGCEVQRY